MVLQQLYKKARTGIDNLLVSVSYSTLRKGKPVYKWCISPRHLEKLNPDEFLRNVFRPGNDTHLTTACSRHMMAQYFAKPLVAATDYLDNLVEVAQDRGIDGETIKPVQDLRERLRHDESVARFSLRPGNGGYARESPMVKPQSYKAIEGTIYFPPPLSVN